MNYTSQVVAVRKTAIFLNWIASLRDSRAIARIAVRIDRLSLGNPGDVRPVGDGVSEMRIDYGAGYRGYVVRRGAEIVVLLCGGDKSSQSADIAHAKRLAQEV